MRQPFEPSPAVVHQPRAIPLQVEALPDGRFRLSTPAARGWAAVAGNAMELTLALRSAFTEVAVASYALARRQPYDLDVLTSHVADDPLAGQPQGRVRGATPTGRRKPYHPADWSKQADESGAAVWVSPSGRRYREDSRVVRDVVSRRAALGLET